MTFPPAGGSGGPSGGRRHPGRSPVPTWAVLAGAVLAISGTVWCTVALPGVTLSAGLLLMLLEVVVVAALTNLFWAVTVALGAVLAANWFLVPPTRTWLVASTEDLILLLVFVIAAVLSSLSVTAALRRTAAASRVLTEAAGLRETLAKPTGEADPAAALGTLALAAELDEVRLDDAGGLEVARWNRELGGEQAAEAAGRDDRRRQLDLDVGDGYRLVASGPEVVGADPRALRTLALAAVRAHQARELRSQAEQAEEVARADRARSALLAAVGHDLRTPLAAIRLAACTLQSADAHAELDAADRDALIGTIADSAQVLDDLIANLLDLSRLEAGRLLVSRTTVAVDAVVAESVVGFASDDVVVDVSDDLPLVDTDPGLLARVLHNLVGNGVRHSGGVVECGARADDAEGCDSGSGRARRVEVLVIDHGPGLPGDLAELAGAFTTTAAGDGGTGLGLAIASGFCQAMGATLHAEATPGGGTTMVVGLEIAT